MEAGSLSVDKLIQEQINRFREDPESFVQVFNLTSKFLSRFQKSKANSKELGQQATKLSKRPKQDRLIESEGLTRAAQEKLNLINVSEENFKKFDEDYLANFVSPFVESATGIFELLDDGNVDQMIPRSFISDLDPQRLTSVALSDSKYKYVGVASLNDKNVILFAEEVQELRPPEMNEEAESNPEPQAFVEPQSNNFTNNEEAYDKKKIDEFNKKNSNKIEDQIITTEPSIVVDIEEPVVEIQDSIIINNENIQPEVIEKAEVVTEDKLENKELNNKSDIDQIKEEKEIEAEVEAEVSHKNNLRSKANKRPINNESDKHKSSDNEVTEIEKQDLKVDGKDNEKQETKNMEIIEENQVKKDTIESKHNIENEDNLLQEKNKLRSKPNKKTAKDDLENENISSLQEAPKEVADENPKNQEHQKIPSVDQFTKEEDLSKVDPNLLKEKQENEQPKKEEIKVKEDEEIIQTVNNNTEESNKIEKEALKNEKMKNIQANNNELEEQPKTYIETQQSVKIEMPNVTQANNSLETSPEKISENKLDSEKAVGYKKENSNEKDEIKKSQNDFTTVFSVGLIAVSGLVLYLLMKK